MARTDDGMRAKSTDQAGPQAWPLRFIHYFDPARDGFVRRMTRLALGSVGLVVVAGLVGLFLILQRPFGRYAASATLLELGWPSMALRVSGQLLDLAPAENGAYYSLHAANLRHVERFDEQLRTLEDGLAALPASGQVHGQYCWYGTLFEGVVPVAAEALDTSCDAAISQAKDERLRGIALARRAMRRAHVKGDFSGAATDMADAFATWDAADVRVRGMPYPWAAWRADVEAGHDPLAGDAIVVERGRF